MNYSNLKLILKTFALFLEDQTQIDLGVDKMPIFIGIFGLSLGILVSRFLSISIDRYYVTGYDIKNNIKPEYLLEGLKHNFNSFHSKITDYSIIRKEPNGYIIYLKVRSYLSFLNLNYKFKDWEHLSEEEALKVYVPFLSRARVITLCLGAKNSEDIYISSFVLRFKIILSYLKQFG
jgi:hypothetical protein